MVTLIGVSGSLRKASFNSAVLRSAATLMPADSALVLESIAGIPLYNGDDEASSGVPPVVRRLKEAIAGADGVLLVTPEYNNGIPGVAKNAFDWLSRPPGDVPRVFRGKPIALAGATPNRFGTLLAQNAWLPVLRNLRMDVWSGGRLLISDVGSRVDASGDVSDPAIRESIRKFMEEFVAYVRLRRAL